MIDIYEESRTWSLNHKMHLHFCISNDVFNIAEMFFVDIIGSEGVSVKLLYFREGLGFFISSRTAEQTPRLLPLP